MTGNLHIPEKFLCEIWKNQKFNQALFTRENEEIHILDPGLENKDCDGPDFSNARIRIGNITYQGDVEVDLNHSDWKSHGHNLNKKYNKVILHLCLNNYYNLSNVNTQEGRKVLSITVKELITEDLRAALQKAIINSRNHSANNIKMPCIDTNRFVDKQVKLDFLHDLGVIRFKNKCNKILDRLKELSYIKEMKISEPLIKYQPDEHFFNKEFTINDFNDPNIWYQLIYELVFEALGYSKNKDIMLKLAKSVDVEFLVKYADKPDFVNYIESAMFFVSGILKLDLETKEEDSSEYLKKMAGYWTEIKENYSSKYYKDVDWKFSKLRPSNFPTIRIAGGARLLYKMMKKNLVGKLIADVNNIDDIRRLTKSIRGNLMIDSDGYWQKHYIFDQKAKEELNYFVGATRVDEIMINVIFPVLAIYFEMYDKKNLLNKVVKLYINFYQNTENALVNDVCKTLDLDSNWKRSVIYQGMIELFRSYCSKDRCMECLIGQKSFEQQD